MKSIVTFLISLLCIGFVYCQNKNGESSGNDSLKRVDTIKASMVYGLLKVPSNSAIPTLKEEDNRYIHVKKEFYNSPGSQKAYGRYVWYYEGGADSSISTFGKHMSRFPDSDSLYKVSITYKKKFHFATAAYIVGFFGTAACVGVLTGKEGDPSITTIGLTGVFGTTFILGVVGRFTSASKMFKHWVFATEAYNSHLYADNSFPTMHKNPLQLSFGLATNYPGIGLKLSF